MKRRSTCLCLSIGLLLVLSGAAIAAAGAQPAILVLSDSARHTVARLGHQRIAADAKAPDAILVSTGGAVSSVFAGNDQAAAAVALADAAGFDVVNLAHRDLAEDPDALAKVIASAKTPFVCATFHLMGKPTPWHDFVLVHRGNQSVAFIGISQRSASLAGASSAKALQFMDPAAAFKAVLPQVAQANQVIVLADATASQAADWLRQFPNISRVILSDRSGGAARVAGQPKIYRAPAGGNAIALIQPDGGIEQLPLLDPQKPSEAYQQLASRYSLDPVVPAAGVPIPPPANASADVLPGLTPGKFVPLELTGRNRAVELSVSSIALLDSFGGHSAPAGTRFLLVNTRWQNVLTPAIVRDQQVPVAYKVPKLSDSLYCVIDGRRVLPRSDETGPGLLSMDELFLPRPGSATQGWLLYTLAADAAPHELSLRFYDYAHGPIILPLVGGQEPIAEKPVLAAQKNQVVEMGIYGIQKLDHAGERTAPKGMHFLKLDVRARSVFTTPADAIAYDPKASPGQKIQIGTVADWQEAHKYAQLVVDGEYAYAVAPQSDLPDQPRFLPDIFTGGTLTFLAPDSARSVQLRCDFPNAALPSGRGVRPAGLVFDLVGKPPGLLPVKAIASARDEIFNVAITGEQATGKFAEETAGDGQKFLVLDVDVQNIGKQQEFFQTKQQLKYATQAGEQIQYDDASLHGTHPPIELLYIPPGERRAFELVYRIGADETRPRLAYAAVSEGASKVLSLPVLEKPAQVAQAPQANAAPSAKPAAMPPQAGQPAAQPGSSTAAAANPAPPSTPPAAASALAQNAAPPAAPASPPSPAAQAPAPPAAAEDPAASAALKPRPHGPAKGLAGVGLTVEQVNQAIDKGARALWNKLKTGALHDDPDAFLDRQEPVLCALALVHADAQKKIPEFDAALRQFLGKVDPHAITSNPTYRLSLLCMLIQAYGDPTFEPKLREAARWLLEAEGADGTWTYGAELPDALFVKPPSTQVLQITGGLPPQLRNEQWKRLTPWGKPRDADNSNTQFALLGLQAAASVGIHLPPEAWQKALDTQLARQCKDGGWAYSGPGSDGYGSMTSAGVCALAICRYELGDANFAAHPAIQRGVAWLDKNFAVGKHPAYGGSEHEWTYYFTYSLERVGRILDTNFIGANEWYPKGAQWLLSSQGTDGLWTGLEGEEKDDPRIATSFALLFLTRGTPPLKPIVRQGPGTLKTDVIASDNRFYVILDASGSMLDTMDGHVKFDIARGAVQSLIDQLPPNSTVALRVYGHRKTALQPGADEDTELKIPMGPLNKPQFTAALQSLRPRGKTPLALSINDAVDDLQGSAGQPVTLLLLTDGGEDTMRPRGKPVPAAARLKPLKNIHFHIIGFDINQPDWAQQLEQMAQVSGGKYWSAARAVDLQRSIRNAVLGIPDTFAVIDEAGHEVAHGQFGQSATLPEGKYHLKVNFGGRLFEQELYISPGEQTAATFDATHLTPGAGVPAEAAAPAQTPAPSATEKPWPKFCKHCGAPLKPGQKFCTNCGQKVEP